MSTMDMGKLLTANLRRKFRYSFEVDGIDGEGSGGTISSYVKSVTSPQLTINPVEVIHQTESVYYPGRISWGTIDVTILDVEGSGNVDIIWNNWIKKYYDPQNAKISWNMSELKKDCKLKILNANGDETGKWTIEGSWPTNLSPGDWDYASSEVQELTFTLQFDRAYYSQ